MNSELQKNKSLMGMRMNSVITSVSDDQNSTAVLWSKYADAYDGMCSINPAYEEIMSMVQFHLSDLTESFDFSLLDVGAGTGNLLSRLAKAYPAAHFTHLDIDSSMNRYAKRKYLDAALSNIEIVENSFLEWLPSTGQFDFITSTNAVYAIHPHEKTLQKLFDLLRPKGALILVDFGRQQNTNDWVRYMVWNSLKRNGIRRTYQIVKGNWEAAKQNRRTTAAQNDGLYWLHSTNEFVSELEKVGFTVSLAKECYRGYSDIAVCTKPA
ncbi:MAG: class I SAM-dependent methyltransferase [Pseudomonadales bacterium]|nr:class I SAM-dependent methyltransferase [Pseudomonadales bacterium]